MKKTDLERLKESRISNLLAQTVTPGRFGKEAAAIVNRREQRRMDQAQGLIPFAVKLHGDLIKRLHTLAQERSIGLNELTEELLRKGLGMPQPIAVPSTAVAPPKPEPVRSEPQPVASAVIEVPVPEKVAATKTAEMPVVPVAMAAAKKPTAKPVAKAPAKPVAKKPVAKAPAKPAAKAPAAKSKAPASKKPAPAKKKK